MVAMVMRNMGGIWLPILSYAPGKDLRANYLCHSFLSVCFSIEVDQEEVILRGV